MDQNYYFPLFIDLHRKNILVIGGGKIATGRIETLLKFTEKVTVVSPEWTDTIQEYERAGRIILEKQFYRTELLKNCDLVLAATNQPEVNEKIVKECRQRGIPVNDASEQKRCDFFFPAVFEADGLIFGVTSGGRDHRKVRETCSKIREWLKHPEKPQEEDRKGKK
jgi:siroheme synthase-like protein